MIEALLAFLLLLPIALLLMLIVRLVRLDTKVKQLENRLSSLESQDLAGVHAHSKPTSEAGQPVTRGAVSSTLSAFDKTRAAQVTEARAQHAQAPVTPGAPAQSASSPVKQPAAPARSRAEWEALIGGKLLNRIGALALIIAVGFFLKYAFDNNWISEWLRVSIGGGIGLGLLWGASRSERKGLAMFAQGLTGAGIAILYLSVYASFNFYHLVPQLVAFALMSLVTAGTFVLGYRSDSLAVALLGFAGGFLTPVMLATDESQLVPLMTYVALLDCGLLAIVAAREKWFVLEPLTLAATWLTWFSWTGYRFTPADTGAAIVFVTVFWAGFAALDIIRTLWNRARYAELRHGAAILSSLLFAAALHAVITPQGAGWSSFTMLCAAILHAAVFTFLRSSPSSDPVQRARYATAGALLLLFATGIRFDGLVLVIACALEAAVMVEVGAARRRPYVWITGLFALLLAILQLLGTPEAMHASRVPEFVPMFNLRAFAFGVVIAALLHASWRCTRMRLPVMPEMLHTLWLVLAVTLLAVEHDDLVRKLLAHDPKGYESWLVFSSTLLLQISWSVLATAVISIGMLKRVTVLRIDGVVLLIITTLAMLLFGSSFRPIASFVPVANMRALAFAVLWVTLLVSMRCFRSDEGAAQWDRMISGVLRVGLVIVALLLVTFEVRDIFEQQTAALGQWRPDPWFQDACRRIDNTEQMSLSGVWLVFSIGLMALGILRRMLQLRIVAIVLFGISILKIFIYDLSSLETLYRIFSFLALGLILLAVSYLYARYKDVIFGG